VAKWRWQILSRYGCVATGKRGSCWPAAGKGPNAQGQGAPPENKWEGPFVRRQRGSDLSRGPAGLFSGRLFCPVFSLLTSYRCVAWQPKPKLPPPPLPLARSGDRDESSAFSAGPTGPHRHQPPLLPAYRGRLPTGYPGGCRHMLELLSRIRACKRIVADDQVGLPGQPRYTKQWTSILRPQFRRAIPVRTHRTLCAN
jgi:hypothetical protein